MALVPFAYNRRSLFVRKVSAVASIAGVAMVVFVFSSVLMLSRGIETTLVSTGHPQNAIVLRKGSTAENQSSVMRASAQVIAVDPNIAADGAGPLVAAETVVLVLLPRRDGGGTSNATVRGIGARSRDVHEGVAIVEGRMFERGKREVIAGRRMAGRFLGAGLGETVKLGRDDYKVVGLFDAGGTGYDSEIWGEADEIGPAFHRPAAFSSITARLRPGTFDAFKSRLEADARFKVVVKDERTFYLEQSKNMALFVKILGLFCAVVFSLGAAIGAMITLYAQVAARTREIGTLRALGFSGAAVLGAFLGEGLLVSLVGGGIGTALSTLMELATFSTVSYTSFSEVVFRFDLTPDIAVKAIAFATVIGLLGGILPAARAARVKVVDALRG